MRGKAGPSSKELKTVAEFEKFVSSNEYVIVGMYTYFKWTIKIFDLMQSPLVRNQKCLSFM